MYTCIEHVMNTSESQIRKAPAQTHVTREGLELTITDSYHTCINKTDVDHYQTIVRDETCQW